MKKVIIRSIILATMIACSNTSSTDHPETSIPLLAEYIGTGDTTINFENTEVDQLPDGFRQTATGRPQILDWKILIENGNKVVAQSAKNGGDYYNLLILDEPGYDNFSMTVRIKALSGKEDQGGGLIWRYIDNNNYYIARCNPLENNFRLYRVVNGNRKQLKSADCSVNTGEWFTMSINMNKNKITCSLNDKSMIEATDDTFPKAGRVGFWTKADALTWFDDLNILSIK